MADLTKQLRGRERTPGRVFRKHFMFCAYRLCVFLVPFLCFASSCVCVLVGACLDTSGAYQARLWIPRPPIPSLPLPCAVRFGIDAYVPTDQNEFLKQADFGSGSLL